MAAVRDLEEEDVSRDDFVFFDFDNVSHADVAPFGPNEAFVFDVVDVAFLVVDFVVKMVEFDVPESGASELDDEQETIRHEYIKKLERVEMGDKRFQQKQSYH